MAQFEAFIGVNFWTALFTLLNTLTIFFVARHFLFRPVMKIIKDRQKEIDGMYSDADTAKGEANAMRNEYQQKLANAQATSDRIVKEAPFCPSFAVGSSSASVFVAFGPTNQPFSTANSAKSPPFSPPIVGRSRKRTKR